MASSSNETLFSMNTLLHMMTIKLSSSNYLLWRNHMLPIFTYQKLLGHIDGTSIAPPSTITVDGKSVSNPAVTTWNEIDQRAVILLQSSLTEESAAEVLGLSTARQIWVALEAAYSNASVERVHSLRDSLRQLTKGTSSVSDYSRRFKTICDQLSAIGHPVGEIDKLHWFLCGLGASYETFSTAIRATKPPPLFRDLVSQAESHELFMLSIHGTPTPPVAFQAQNTGFHSSHARGRSDSSRGSSSRGRGRGQYRRPKHCQLCRTNGHYATECPSLASFATKASIPDDTLAKAFHAQCHVTSNSPDWHVDSGATDHMTSSHDSLTHTTPYKESREIILVEGLKLEGVEAGIYNVHCLPLRLFGADGCPIRCILIK